MLKVRLLVLVALALVACQPDPPTPVVEIAPSPSVPPELIFENIDLTETDTAGRPIWRLQATRAAYAAEIAQLSGISGELITQAGEMIAIEAALGRVDLIRRRLTLEGALQVQVSDLSLIAARVEWLPEANQLQAVGDVFIQRAAGNLDIQADQALMDFSTQVLTLSGEAPIRVTASAPELSGTMQSLRWELEAARLVGTGAVQVEGDEFRLTGSQLDYDFNSATIALSQAAIAESSLARLSADQITWVVNAPTTVASGAVRYTSAKFSVEGNQGTANWQTNTFVVDGGRSSSQLVIR